MCIANTVVDEDLQHRCCRMSVPGSGRQASPDTDTYMYLVGERSELLVPGTTSAAPRVAVKFDSLSVILRATFFYISPCRARDRVLCSSQSQPSTRNSRQSSGALIPLLIASLVHQEVITSTPGDHKHSLRRESLAKDVLYQELINTPPGLVVSSLDQGIISRLLF